MCYPFSFFVEKLLRHVISDVSKTTVHPADRPRSNLRQSKNSAALGTSVALQCDVDSNPEPDFFNWTHNDNALNESGREVTILVNSDNDFGLYLCTATLKDFGSSEPITFHIVGRMSVFNVSFNLC